MQISYKQVRICYKIKIDSRDFNSGFYCFLLHHCPRYSSVKPLLHPHRAASITQKSNPCITTEAPLQCKSCSLATSNSLFDSPILCTFSPQTT